MNTRPTISVVTICYNAAQIIEQTIQSVLSQTYTDYEYVFIDGASKDGTVSIIESYRQPFEKKGIAYRVISEPDGGIYDAMNKGAARSEGEWVLMLNAGDALLHEKVFAQVFEGKTYQAAVLYGNTVLQEMSRGGMRYKKVPARPLENMDEGMVFCHQSAFVQGEALRRYGFDASFKIVADYEQFLRMRKDGLVFTKVETYISLFDGSGVSMAKPEATLAEYKAARIKNGIVPKKQWLAGLLQWMKYALRQTIRKVLSGWFYSEKRGWYSSLDDMKW